MARGRHPHLGLGPLNLAGSQAEAANSAHGVRSTVVRSRRDARKAHRAAPCVGSYADRGRCSSEQVISSPWRMASSIEKLLDDLDSDSFEAREAASAS